MRDKIEKKHLQEQVPRCLKLQTSINLLVLYATGKSKAWKYCGVEGKKKLFFLQIYI